MKRILPTPHNIIIIMRDLFATTQLFFPQKSVPLAARRRRPFVFEVKDNNKRQQASKPFSLTNVSLCNTLSAFPITTMAVPASWRRRRITTRGYEGEESMVFRHDFNKWGYDDSYFTFAAASWSASPSIRQHASSGLCGG
eukprot:scaffold7808_cov184-Amphora_coffeaeformis.AAC.18